MGGAAVLLSTIGSSETVATLLPSLSPSGRLILLGVGKDSLNLSMGALVGGERG